jgi:hypothetical protein
MTTKLLGQYTTGHSVCREAWSHSVRTVYENAIEVTTAPRVFVGWRLLLPLIFLALFSGVAALSLPLLSDLLREGGRGVLVALLVSPVLAFAWAGALWLVLYLWLEHWRKPFDLPQLYNRRSGVVYLMEETPPRELTWQLVCDLLNPVERRRWFGARSVRVIAVPWASLVVEDYEVTTPMSHGPAIKRRWLSLVVAEALGGMPMVYGKVLLRFDVGRAGADIGPSTRAEEWEHVRRYMRHEGPALVAGHALVESRGAQSWWVHLGVSSAFGPGYLGFWREHPVLSGFIHLLLPLTLPLALLTATLGWLSDLAAHEVAWPDWVLQEAGPVIENP